MHLREGEYEKAHTDFFEAFKNYDESGSPRWVFIRHTNDGSPDSVMKIGRVSQREFSTLVHKTHLIASKPGVCLLSMTLPSFRGVVVSYKS